MRTKLFTLIVAVLSVMTISATPSKVEGQGLVEKKGRVLMIAGLGMGERVEGYYLLLQPLSPGTTRPSEPPLAGVAFDLWVSGPSDASGNGTCTETVPVTLDILRPITILNVQMGEGYDSLLVNGDPVPLPKTCSLMDKARVVVAVVDPIAAGRAFDGEFGVQTARFLGHSIVEFLTGKTRAASTGIDLPLKLLVFEDEVGEVQ